MITDIDNNQIDNFSDVDNKWEAMQHGMCYA